MNMSDITFYDDTFDFDPKKMEWPDYSTRLNDPDLPPPGYYEIRILSADVVMSSDNPGKHWESEKKKGLMAFILNRIAVIQPTEYEGSFPVFQKLFTNGFHPYNVATSTKDLTKQRRYPFLECLAAISGRDVLSSKFDDNVKALGAALDTHPTATVSLTWKGHDKKYAATQLARGVSKDAAYRSADMKLNEFKLPDGTYSQFAVGPSGEMVRARLQIKEWVLNDANVLRNIKLGPYARRTPALSPVGV